MRERLRYRRHSVILLTLFPSEVRSAEIRDSSGVLVVPERLFEHRFGSGTGFRERRFFVISEAMWRLHLSGPGAMDLVRQRWPDLEAATVRSYVQGSQTPWFAPGREVKYVTLKSAADPAVMVMLNPQSSDLIIAYDPA